MLVSNLQHESNKLIYLEAIFSINILRSFSKGVKFKSRGITLLILFDLSRTGTMEATEKTVLLSSLIISVRWRLIWPPSVWPIENSWSHSWHSCIFGLTARFKAKPTSWTSFVVVSASLILLWLALCPPRAWNEGNWRLHVLHWKTSFMFWLWTNWHVLRALGQHKQTSG